MRTLFCFFFLGASACATQLPPQQFEATSSSIRAAEEVGAEKIPQAALHLQLAKEQADMAKKVAEKGDAESAKLILMRAQADAELAVALARTDQQKQEAQQAIDEVKKLQGGTK